MNTQRWVILLTGVWAGCYAASFLLSYMAEPTGDGFTRGWNRILIWLGWQTVALGVAIVALVVTRRGRERIGTSLYRVGHFPASVSGLTSLGIVATAVWLTVSA